MDNFESKEKFKIAIVDDEPDVLENLKDLFESEGYKIQCYSDPVLAFEAVKQDLPDLLLTDISMPRMSGLELLSALRNIVPDLPVIVLSGHVDIPNLTRSLRLSATDVITKPYQSEVLLDAVALAVSVGRCRKRIAQILSDSKLPESQDVLSELRRAQRLLAARAL
jgi:FixJ family two-component response regulator